MPDGVDAPRSPEGTSGALEFSQTEMEVLASLRNSKRVDLRWLSEEEKTKMRDALDGLHNGKKVSLFRISKEVGRSYTAIWGLCRALEIHTRNPSEASKESAEGRAKHKRKPFDGTKQDQAYMLGFKNGDLTAWQVSGTAVMVTSTTTHPAFAKLFRETFQKHGHVYEYPMKDEEGVYKWKVATRLDNSFQFLLSGAEDVAKCLSSERGTFLSWLAGLLDADGHINIGSDEGYIRVRIDFGTVNRPLLELIKETLIIFGYFPTGPYLQYESGFTTPRGISYRSDMWRLDIQRTGESVKLLNELPVRHPEKVLRKQLALSIGHMKETSDVIAKLDEIRSSIHQQVSRYAELARIEYEKRKSRRAGARQ